MSTQIASELCVHQPVDAYERQVIEANRRLAEAGITRIDRRDHGGIMIRVDPSVSLHDLAIALRDAGFCTVLHGGHYTIKREATA